MVLRYRLYVFILIGMLPLGVSASPSLSNLLAPDTALLYEKFEATFDVATVATNCYWPYEPNTPPSIPPGVGVTVDGLFSCDNWQTSNTVPAFYYQDYSRRLVTGTGKSYTDEANTPAGEPHWRLRFAPTQTGTWRYKIRVTDSSGTTTSSSENMSFNCISSSSHGFVRVSRTDSRYFELSDRTPVVSAGINAHFRSTYEADSLLQTFGNNGVRTVRWWMNYREWQNPFAGGDAPVNGGPQWDFGLILSSKGGHKSGDRYAAELAAGRDTRQHVYLTAGVLYRFTGFIKTDAVVAAAGNGIIPYVNTAKWTATIGTNDWTEFTVNYTPSASGDCLVGVRHTGTGGAGYFDDLSLKSSTDGGITWSGEYLSKPDLDTQNYIDLKEAWKVDHIFESAKQYGVYLKTVITEKQDPVLGRIGLDGSTVAQSDDNVYASAAHPSRWLQKAWWRYATARWSAYTSLHSWEFLNEGDPFSVHHYDGANALADYVHGVDPNSHLCTTSFWHSIPMDFWKNSSCDYIDVHEYIGPITTGTASHGPRFYAWYDGMTSDSNVLLPMDVNGGRWSIDDTTAHSGSRSTKLIAYAGWTRNPEAATRQFHVGIDPSHRYTCRYWAKADDIGSAGGSVSWVKPGIKITWSRAYHENDFVGQSVVNAALGTYDWTQSTSGGITPPSTANTANIQITCPQRPVGEAGDGTFWVDDIEFIDETTGENLFLDGGVEGDRIDYDSALAVRKYGSLINSYGKRIGKPGIWAETGLRGANEFGSPYKGYSYTEENQRLADDTGGVHLKKMIWAHICYDNPNMLVWWTDNITGKNLWPLFKAFQSFITDVPLSNGHYVDAAALTTDPSLRAWGQKDLTSNKALLWIDNSNHTWKKVVDGVTIPPVSGTVTITGLRNGPYKVEWWDTSTGVVTSTEPVECIDGKINLPISGLATDKACKIYQGDASPPSGSAGINGGAAYTTSNLVTLSLSATDAESGVSTMRFSNDGNTWSTWESFAASKSWSLSPGDGIRTVYVQFMNGDGIPSLVYYDSIISDTLQPSGTIIINSGIACTGSADVLLTMTATDTASGVTDMRFSNDAVAWSAWQPFEQTKAWTTAVGDGTKTVYVQFMDGATNISQNYSDTIVLQTSGPTGSIVINAGRTYATSISATLTLSAIDDACGVSGMRFSNNGSAWTAWEEYGTSKAWTLTAGDGAKTVYAQYKDCADNLSNICTGNITVDTTPPACSIVINGGDAQTNTASVTLTLSATDEGSGVSRMRFSNDDSTWATWESYADSKSWILVSGDGTKTVYVQYEDGAGNVSTSYSDSIELIATVPIGSVTINNGDAYTNSTSVTLNLSDGGSAAVQMRFSGDDITWSSWEAYATNKSWSLSSGTGDRTVYAEFENSDGATSSPCSDIIVLDTSQPTGSININAGAQYANSANVTVNASVSDTGSGPAQMRLSNDGSTWSAWEPFAASKSWALTSGNGSRTVYAQFNDGVGNTSSFLSDTITLDAVQPTGSVNINSGATYATSTSITLSLFASDDGSGVVQMRFSNDGTTWSSWESYGTSKSWTLTAGDGTKTVWAQYKDGAGNTCQNCTDTIMLTSSGPTGTITINGGAQYVKTRSVTLALSASEGPSGVPQMRFSNDGTTWSAWESFAASKSWSLLSGDGIKTVYAQFEDEVGRVSPSYSDTIIVKTTGPKLSITSPTSYSNYTTNHPSLAISGTASSDAVSLAWATNSGDIGECIGTTAWVTDEIALTEGENTVTITAMDGAGTTAAMSVTLDRVNVHPPDTWAGAMMVSIPIIPDEPDPKTAVGFDGNAWCIFRPTQNNYVVYGTDPEQLTWFLPAAGTPGRGFWASFSDTAKTPLGSIPRQDQPATIHLYPGWNIIGNPFVSPVQWDVKQIAVLGVGGSQKTLQNSRNVVDDFAYGWRHSEGVGTYYIVYDSSLWPGVDDTLRPWMAYWIRAYRECDLVIPAPPYDP